MAARGEAREEERGLALPSAHSGAEVQREQPHGRDRIAPAECPFRARAALRRDPREGRTGPPAGGARVGRLRGRGRRRGHRVHRRDRRGRAPRGRAVRADRVGRVRGSRNRALALGAARLGARDRRGRARLRCAARGDPPRPRAGDASVAGYRMPRLSFFLGRPIRHGSWYPDTKLRLGRRSSGLRAEGGACTRRSRSTGPSAASRRRSSTTLTATSRTRCERRRRTRSSAPRTATTGGRAGARPACS